MRDTAGTTSPRGAPRKVRRSNASGRHHALVDTRQDDSVRPGRPSRSGCRLDDAPVLERRVCCTKPCRSSVLSSSALELTRTAAAVISGRSASAPIESRRHRRCSMMRRRVSLPRRVPIRHGGARRSRVEAWSGLRLAAKVLYGGCHSRKRVPRPGCRIESGEGWCSRKTASGSERCRMRRPASYAIVPFGPTLLASFHFVQLLPPRVLMQLAPRHRPTPERAARRRGPE